MEGITEPPHVRRANEAAAAAQRAHGAFAAGIVEFAEFVHSANAHGGVPGDRMT